MHKFYCIFFGRRLFFKLFPQSLFWKKYKISKTNSIFFYDHFSFPILTREQTQKFLLDIFRETPYITFLIYQNILR